MMMASIRCLQSAENGHYLNKSIGHEVADSDRGQTHIQGLADASFA